jgi:uncharacterized protein (TIGR03437 family)
VTQGTPPGEIAQSQTALSAPVTVTIGGQPATVSYAGLAPNFVGLYRFNVTVPSIAASASAPVVVTLGGATLPQKLFLPVQ